MTISVGFYNRIQEWLMDEYTNEIAFRPFQINGNPYKSKIFIVSTTPEPLAYMDVKNKREYANSLVSHQLFNQTHEEELGNASREYKGTLKFVEWMKETHHENVVISNVNCYVAKDVELFKNLKKSNSPLIKKGKRIFKEVVEEFSPSIIILQGSKTLKEFKSEFPNHLVVKDDLSLPVQELENRGVIATLNLDSGKRCLVMVCRSLSYFGKSGDKFTRFKEELDKTLKSL